MKSGARNICENGHSLTTTEQYRTQLQFSGDIKLAKPYIIKIFDRLREREREN